MNRIIFANENYKVEIDRLRMTEYARASGFAVDLSTLQWKPTDNESYVMAAEVGNQLISTMRGEVIEDRGLLEHKLECPWNFSAEIDMPVLLLSRAATLSEYRANGLNLVLRYWFLRLAIFHNINFVVGTFVSGSPRENTLREMGYQFFENSQGWQQSTYRSLRPVSVVILNMKTHGAQALDYCLKHSAENINNYAFDGAFPELRTVRNI